MIEDPTTTPSVGGTTVGTSGSTVLQDAINRLNQVGVGGGTTASGAKVIDGIPMTYYQALNYINTLDAKNPTGYNQMIQVMRDAGYPIPQSKNPGTVRNMWKYFVDALYGSDYQDLTSFAADRYSGTTGTGTSIFEQASITDKATAQFELQQAFNDYVGTIPSNFNKISNLYYKALSKLEFSRPTRQVTKKVNGKTVQTTIGGVSAEEKEQLLLSFVGKFIQGADVEDIGGTVANTLTSIRKYASDMGIQLPDSDIRQFAVQSVIGKEGLQNVQAKINKMSSAVYKAAAPYIAEGLTLRDIASPFISKKAQVLELDPNQISVTRDKDISDLFTGEFIPSLYDFEISLRNNPIWQYTENAISEAANYVTSLLKDFGLM